MKKILLGIAAALVLAACSENKQQETTEAVDTASVVTDLMMSRRSIRAYKDSVISRETLDEILACGINAPNGMNRQSYELRVIDSPALIDSITEAVVKDNPAIAERKGFKNIFVNAPCVICIAYDTQYDMAQIDCGLLGEKNQFAAQTVLACRNDNFAWGCFHCLHLLHTLVLSWTCRTEVAGVALVIEKPASGKRILFAVLGCAVG